MDDPPEIRVQNRLLRVLATIPRQWAAEGPHHQVPKAKHEAYQAAMDAGWAIFNGYALGLQDRASAGA